MSMYVSVLSSALELFEPGLDDDALIEHVRKCRHALPPWDLGSGTYSAEALAVEIAYDRALVCLADRFGIDVTPAGFAHPKIERERLEFALLEVGVDLGVATSPRFDEAPNEGRPE